MRTTFLTLMAATLAVTTLTGCKKDSGDDDDNVIRFTDPNLTVAVGKTAQVKLFVPSGSGIADIKSNNTQVAIAEKTTNYLLLNIIGVKEGNTTVEVKNGNRTQKAVLNVHVFKENIAKNGGFEVDNSIIFLKKGQDTDITGRFKKGSGNFKVTTPSTAVARVRQEGHRWIATGWGEGLTENLTFIDMVGTKTITVPVYVIKPFKAVGAPTELVQNSVYNIILDGVYTTTTAVDGRFDRMQMNVSGNTVIAQFITTDVKAQNGVKLGEKVTGIRVTAKNVGTGTVNLINGDGQTLNLNFNVKALVADNFFNVDADGVATVKTGVTLPSHVVLPANAKKLAREAFKNQNNLESVNLTNVEVIDQDAFMGCSKLTTVTMPAVKVIEGGAFRASGLRDVVLPASLQRIERGAFDTAAIQNVTCQATTPPVIDSPFSTLGGTNRKLYVPAGSIESYYNNSAWRNVLTGRAFDGLKNNGYKPLPIQ